MIMIGRIIETRVRDARIDGYNTSSIDRVIGVSPLVGGLLGSAI